MTFSTHAVVDTVEANWIPVWERVAPVREATFDLGEGDSVTGTISGEIALHFCRPDGVVFDVLPGLQSPAVTLAAIEEAFDFYATTGATSEAIAKRHRDELAAPGALSPDDARASRDRSKAKLTSRRKDADEASRDLAEMALSKVVMIAPAETLTLVEPGGLAIFEALVHEMLSQGEERTPEGWKVRLFEEILEQPLSGGTVVYDAFHTGPLLLKD